MFNRKFIHLILYFFIQSFIPESVRWLLVNKRYDEAENILKKAADVNGFAYPLHATLKRVEQHCKGGNVLQLFSDSSLATYTVLSAFVW